MSLTRFKLVFFTPTTSTSTILNHLFTTFPQSLGKIGNYEHCAFITKGTGQFKPTAEANPAIGEAGKLEFVEEHKVEIVVNDKGENKELLDAIQELKKVHPYEEVAYDIYRLENF
ncbi:hypothetical protein JAAARDRAFT_309935 [Jaapia argillacea MUCL 33604]|uniref:ATP phosphoribosyltransferase n=1 Tax=Jaapia argillacea MUCL 33604 TaxID=933084 RepID=A0A067PNH6_9AGAM|nr:hypothetical protein JAAARDRAFT_309935 [Jaapia argillacea MUCL 33604]